MFLCLFKIRNFNLRVFFILEAFINYLFFLTKNTFFKMPNTNAPRNIATESGNIFLETEFIDSQRRQRQIPIVDVGL